MIRNRSTLIEQLERAMDNLDRSMPLTNGRDKTHPEPKQPVPSPSNSEKAA